MFACDYEYITRVCGMFECDYEYTTLVCGDIRVWLRIYNLCV